MDKSVKWLLIIMAVAAALRVLLFVVIYPDENKFFRTDSYHYDLLAINLIEHPIFSSSFGALRPPAYPLFLAFVYAVLGHKPFIAILLQLPLDLITLYVTYKIGEILFSRAIGVVGASFVAMDIGQILYTNQLLRETLLTCLLSLSIYYLLRFFREERVRYGVWAGFSLGATALCSTIAFYLPVFLMIPFLARYKNALLSGLRKYAIVLLCFLAMIMPWLGRNYYVFGVLNFTTNQGHRLLLFNVRYLRARTGNMTLAEPQQELEHEMREIEEWTLNPFERADSCQKRAIEEILRHPYDYAVVHLGGLVPLFAGSNVRQVVHQLGMPTGRIGTGFLTYILTKGPAAGFEALQKFPEKFLDLSKSEQLVSVCIVLEIGLLMGFYLLSAYGLWLNLQEKRLVSITVLGTVVMYLALAAGPSGDARFRVPMMPYIYLFASYGLYKLCCRQQAGND